MYKSGQHNYLLDFARIILILWIILFHYTVAFKEGIIDVQFPFVFKHGGPVGVTCFFIISGFFMGKPIFKDTTMRFKDYINYCWKRYLRFWPEYAISVVIIYLWLQIWPVETRMSSFSDFIFNFVFIWHPGFEYVDGAHWFLAVLVITQFATVMLLFVDRKYREVLVYGLFVLLVAFTVYIGFPRHGLSILLASEVKILFGVILYNAYNNASKYGMITAAVGGG